MECQILTLPRLSSQRNFRHHFSEPEVTRDVAAALGKSAERIRRYGWQQTKAVLATRRELIAAMDLLPSDRLGPWSRRLNVSGCHLQLTRPVATGRR